MRRRLLVALTAVGSVIVALGAVGVFAALKDQALSETNEVTTAAQAAAADILVAKGRRDLGGWNCSPGQDNLTSALFFLEAEDFAHPELAGFCVWNVGAAPVELSSVVQELTDTDVDCTGDEKEFDETCGLADGQPQKGELADSLVLTYFTGSDCTQAPTEPVGAPHTLLKASAAPLALGRLEPGHMACFEIQLSLDAKYLLTAQSDRVTWRFRWDATAVDPLS